MLQTAVLISIALLAAKALLIGSEFNFILWLRNWQDYPNWYFNRESWQLFCARKGEDTRATRESLWILPWEDPIFDGWNISGLNHYWEADNRRKISISLSKNGCRQTISASGVDDELIWDELARKVKETK